MAPQNHDRKNKKTRYTKQGRRLHPRAKTPGPLWQDKEEYIYIPQLHRELDFQEVLYNQDNKTDNVTNLITLLKQDENIRHKLDDKGFRSLTDFQWYL